MRLWWLSILILSVAGCSHDSASPETPADPSSTKVATSTDPPPTPEELSKLCDVSMYPGSKAPDGMSRAPVKATGETHYDLALTTTDPIDKVVDYYSKEMKSPPSTLAGAKSIIGKTPHGNDAIISVGTENKQTVIRIKAIAYGH